MKRINDPIYGIIDILYPTESDIINTPIFQRLRDIKQLSLTYYIYPSATHDRFSHSIGVMYLVDKIFCLLQKEYGNKYAEFLNEKARKNLRMAALLHDIGHFPFSHTLEFSNEDFNENQLTKLPDYIYKGHENLTEYLINNSYIKQILETDEDYEIETICGFITGKSTTNLVLSNLIHWDLDADRFDYLLRDSYYTGVKFGIVDYNYLINNLQIHPEEDPFIIINYKAARSIEQVLIGRYSLFDRVYTHKIRLYYEYLLRKLVLIYLDYIFPNFFKNEKDFKEVLNNKESILFFEFSDSFIIKKLCQIYQKIKSKKRFPSNLKNIKEDLESLILRRKNDIILRYPFISKKKPIDITGRYQKIIELLESIEPNFSSNNSDICLNYIKNKFTSYRGYSYSPWDIIPSTVKEIDKRSIIIGDTSGNLKPFFLWNGSYFKDIYKNQSFGIDIYIKKHNQGLIDKYMNQIECQIKELLKD